MDFDMSKENIQPLRGGRNVQQLEIGLQAQTNRELQLQLMQEKEMFENLIRTYEGDDPLDNYYNYISWVEQSYPKHGHEGNLVPLLEHCLRLFENDKRYTNDRRFCKLWIKYFDLQQNPLELYHMMKAKGLCCGCADLYRAWAYYHEAAGDFKSAYEVFEEGKRALAQPYEDLEHAHKNLVMAAGQHFLFGPDENKLNEKRQALTSLNMYRPGRVSSMRVPSSNGIVTLPSSSTSGQRSNAPVYVYEGAGAGAEAAPISIIAAARRLDVTKENTLKPGVWTTVPVKKRVIGSNVTPGFTILEDVDIPEGIRLPKDHRKETLEDYSDFKVSIKWPEPPNPAVIPVYPKDRVYIDPNTEYSLEELRSVRYLQKARNRELPNVEQQILEDVEYMQESLDEIKNDIFQRSVNNQARHNEFLHRPAEQDHLIAVAPFAPYQDLSNANFIQSNFPAQRHDLQLQTSRNHQQQSQPHHALQNEARMDKVDVQSPFSSLTNATASNNFDLWSSPPAVAKPAAGPFVVFEQSLQDIQTRIQPKGSAMKTAFKVLNADELAETGSRGGMDVAATAQATDSAMSMPLFNDNSSSSYEELLTHDQNQDIDATCNTYAFNFNLNVRSTPNPPNHNGQIKSPDSREEEMGSSRKQLFPGKATGALSIIYEETKSYGSSSNSRVGKSSSVSVSNDTSNKMGMGVISEEHNSYLAQNLMANAALRSSLLGNLMDFGQCPSPPVAIHEEPLPMPPLSPINVDEDVSMPMLSSPLGSPTRRIPAPSVVTPLDFSPSDPFKAGVIAQLLERVAFPGPHKFGYVELSFNPRIFPKKEPVLIGKEKYIVDKQLGKGTFGTVYKAIDLGTNAPVALKFQKPPNRWEFYICRELQSRLAEHPLRERFMDVTLGYFADQASILISEYMPGGSLLDLANLHKQKSGKTMKECLVMHFCIQMLKVVQTMHEAKIIHADIKPDNFLVFILPDNTVGLQLIDFGCSIDMSLFPPNAAFTRRVTTEDFVCCEMLDGKPWNYHTDMFCIAATAHVLLFDSYIKLKKHDGLWCIIQRFTRYMKVDLWNMFFSNLLNQQTGPADAATLQLMLDETLAVLNKDTSTSLPSQMRYVVNLLKNR